ncbi:MAG: hypothetical protein J6U01_02940 [Clostridia bacterium]|nr:hypothetical protein [Clostridia bacterium]
MKKRMIALLVLLAMVLSAACGLAEAGEGENLIGRWDATAESLAAVLELPEGHGQAMTVAIARQGDFFDIQMEWTLSPAERISWVLSGSYDPANEELFGFGTKTRLGLDASGEVISASVENDEVNAEFYLDENGKLTWWDSEEGLEGILFEKAVMETAE